MACGIYKIVNKINGKFYIGGSNDINNRWHEHIISLKRNSHCSSHFQRAWNKYGKNSFEFIILEECSEEVLKEREQYYLDTLKPWKREVGYNVCKKSLGTKGIRWREEQKEKIRGECHSQAKLSVEDVKNIRLMYLNGNSFRKIKEKYNICVNHIGKIVHYRSWEKEEGMPYKKEEILEVIKKRKEKSVCKGENKYNSKLTNEQAQEIRNIYKKGQITQQQISKIYNIGQQTISRIINNLSYI